MSMSDMPMEEVVATIWLVIPCDGAGKRTRWGNGMKSLAQVDRVTLL